MKIVVKPLVLVYPSSFFFILKSMAGGPSFNVSFSREPLTFFGGCCYCFKWDRDRGETREGQAREKFECRALLFFLDNSKQTTQKGPQPTNNNRTKGLDCIRPNRALCGGERSLARACQVIGLRQIANDVITTSFDWDHFISHSNEF